MKISKRASVVLCLILVFGILTIGCAAASPWIIHAVGGIPVEVDDPATPNLDQAFVEQAVSTVSNAVVEFSSHFTPLFCVWWNGDWIWI